VIKVVVSACLLGSPVRYDGRDKKSSHPVLQRWLDEGRIVSVCPEMLGGLGTPRPPAEIAAGRVVTNEGKNVTDAFESGARAVVEQTSTHRIRVAILKEGSPSCGSTFVYDGTFTKTKVAGEGITTTALRNLGIVVFSEEQLDAAEEYVAALERRNFSESGACGEPAL
jgi:uncharacterized protein YbbK (DUF523 family)